MEGQSGNENPLQLMTFSSGGNVDACYVPKDDTSQHLSTGSGRNETTNALLLSQWTHSRQTSHSYVKFLEESSTFLHKAPTKDVVETIPLPVDSIHGVHGVSEIPNEVLYTNLVKACGFNPADSFIQMDAWKEMSSVTVLNNNYHGASTSIAGSLCSGQNKVTYLKPHNEGEELDQFASTQYQIHTQECTSKSQEQNEDNFDVSMHDPKVTVSAPSFPSRSRTSASRQRAAATDRQRRRRIDERIKALQVLLPHSEEVRYGGNKGGNASVLDDIIDHVKYLQLQIKDLSRSRLGGESTSDPFIFLEGYGHYILHEQMLNEPLEEMMGKLLEVNPSEATQLLESRGLYVMPMTMVEGLLQTM